MSDNHGPNGVPDDPGADGSGTAGHERAIIALAGEAIDAADIHALDVLSRALDAHDPMPAGLVERATFAVALEELEVEVASLQRDGRAAGRDLAGVRSTDDHTLTMTFTASALSLTVAVVPTGRDRHRIDGWITTEHSAIGVVLRLGSDAERTGDVEDGRFAFSDVPSGMVQVVVSSDDDAAAMVVTPVFEL